MAYSLAEYKKMSQDPLIAGVYQSFIDNSPILDKMVFENINGGAISFNRETTLGTTAFRAVGNAYSTSEGTITTVTESLAIAGGKITIDRALPVLYGEERLAASINMKQKSLARLINETMIKGTGSSDDFTGFQSRAGSTIDNGTGALSLGSLDEAAAEVHGENKYWIMGKGAWLRLTAATRNSALNGNIQIAQNEFGMPAYYYAGIPVMRAGQDAAGDEVLDFSETDSTTSIYLVSFDDNGVRGVQNGGVRIYRPVTESTASEYDIEWYMNYIAGDAKSIVRVSGITDAAIVA